MLSSNFTVAWELAQVRQRELLAAAARHAPRPRVAKPAAAQPRRIKSRLWPFTLSHAPPCC